MIAQSCGSEAIPHRHHGGDHCGRALEAQGGRVLELGEEQALGGERMHRDYGGEVETEPLVVRTLQQDALLGDQATHLLVLAPP